MKKQKLLSLALLSTLTFVGFAPLANAVDVIKSVEKTKLDVIGYPTVCSPIVENIELTQTDMVNRTVQVDDDGVLRTHIIVNTTGKGVGLITGTDYNLSGHATNIINGDVSDVDRVVTQHLTLTPKSGDRPTLFTRHFTLHQDGSITLTETRPGYCQ